MLEQFRQRELVASVHASHGVSQRRSCLALDVDRSLVRYVSVKPDQAPLRLRIHDLARTRTRYGYFRIYIMLRREGWLVNHKARLPSVSTGWTEPSVQEASPQCQRRRQGDKAPIYGLAIADLKKEGKLPDDTIHRQVKYLNNVLEADHGKLKQLIKPVRGIKTLKTAYATIKGYEVIHTLRKGQAALLQYGGGIMEGVRLIERQFNVYTA